MPSLTSITPGAGLSQEEQKGYSQWEIDQICEGPTAAHSGLSQEELDQLCHTEDDESCHHEDDEPVSSALYNAKRKRRITFSGMSEAICAVPIPEEEEDLRGGFTQAVLDRMSVVGEPSGRLDDSPVGTALRRRKLGRMSVASDVSTGSAGVENMIKVATDVVSPQAPSPNPTFESPSRSPRKRRSKNKESENIGVSPSKNIGVSPSKNIGVSPNKAMSLENSPVKVVGKEDPVSPPRKVRMAGSPLNPLSPLNPQSPLR